MGRVIYSDNPLQLSFWLSIVSLIISAWGGYFALDRMSYPGWRQIRGVRGYSPLVTGVGAIILCLFGIGLTFVWLPLMIGGSEIITVQLNDKQIVTENCGKDQTCTHYVLEMQSDSKFYKPEVPKDTYEKAKVNACYSVTYYPGNGSMNLFNISRIESTACP